MKEWIARNWRPMLVLALSLGDAALVRFEPQWSLYEALGVTLLASVGVHLIPITWTQAAANRAADKMADRAADATVTFPKE